MLARSMFRNWRTTCAIVSRSSSGSSLLERRLAMSRSRLWSPEANELVTIVSGGLFETSTLIASARLARLRQAVHGGIDTICRHLHAGACLDGLHRLTEALGALQEFPAAVAQRPLGRRPRAADVERRHDPLERAAPTVLATIWTRVARPDQARHLLGTVTAPILVDRHVSSRLAVHGLRGGLDGLHDELIARAAA